MRDLIDRQAAIDALGERPMVWMDSDYEIAQRNQYDMDRLAIETVPSAQPERKKGKWMLHTYMPHNKYCSCCEKDSPYNKLWNFCPNCGAYMRGGQNE